MKSWTIVLAVFLSITGNALALSEVALKQLKEEVSTLLDAAGDVWDNSGTGGYVFQFSEDIFGDSTPVIFVSSTLSVNKWHIFTGKNGDTYLGDVNGGGWLLKKEKGEAVLMDAFHRRGDDRGTYVVEYRITRSGIKFVAKMVGKEITEEQYEAVSGRTVPGAKSIPTKMEGILLYDLLHQASPQWFSFSPDKLMNRDGYYRFLDDDKIIDRFKDTFTPQIAVELLNKKLVKEK